MGVSESASKQFCFFTFLKEKNIIIKQSSAALVSNTSVDTCFEVIINPESNTNSCEEVRLQASVKSYEECWSGYRRKKRHACRIGSAYGNCCKVKQQVDKENVSEFFGEKSEHTKASLFSQEFKQGT